MFSQIFHEFSILFLFRHLGSCGILAERRTSFQLRPALPMRSTRRTFISLAAPISNRRMEYTESRILEQVSHTSLITFQTVNQNVCKIFWRKKVQRSSRAIKSDGCNFLCDCLFRYTPEEMYNVVANVEEYKYFVPWCKKSRMVKGPNGDILAELEIGFPPITERYTSKLTFVPNHQVRVSSQNDNYIKVYYFIYSFIIYILFLSMSSNTN